MARTAKVRAEDRRQLVDVAYRKAVRRSDVVERTICLEALAPALESDQLDSVINAALAIEDDSLRARVLVAVAPHLSSELKERVVRSLNAFAEAWLLASVIEALGPAVNTKAADLFEQARFFDERSHAKLLTALAERLPAHKLPAMLQRSLEFEDELAKQWILTVVAPFLNEDDLKRATDAVLAFDDTPIPTLTAFAAELKESAASGTVMRRQAGSSKRIFSSEIWGGFMSS